MKQNSFYLALLFCVALFGCDKVEQQEEKKGVAVETVEATSCVDLTARSDWKFLVMNNEYNYRADGTNIWASMKDTPYLFRESYSLGSKIPIGGGPVIRLVSPGYFRENKTKDMAPPAPLIDDQTTPEKLKNADLLSMYYYGEVSENITGVSLTHANALLDFNVTGLSGNFDVQIESYQLLIAPYKNGDRYNAVVLAEGGEYNASVVVRIGNENYTLSLLAYSSVKSSPLPSGNSILRDTRYKFTVKYDDTTKSLSIENIETSVWSEEK